MSKEQLIEKIVELLKETNDTITLGFIYNFLKRTSLKNTSQH